MLAIIVMQVHGVTCHIASECLAFTSDLTPRAIGKIVTDSPQPGIGHGA